MIDYCCYKNLENSSVIIVLGLSSGTGDFNVSSKRCNTSYDWIELQKKAAVIGDKESVTSGQYLYRVFHLRMCFLKGLKMSENQYVDKKKKQ